MEDRTKFAPNFPLSEMTVTQQADANGVRLVNAPGVNEHRDLIRTSWKAQEARTICGVPLRVTSGFRCEAVERKVQKRPTGPLAQSQHMRGQAVDFIPIGLPVWQAFEALFLSPIEYDQAILEAIGGAHWIHLSVPPEGRKARMMAIYTSDGVNYRPYVSGAARAITGGA